MAENNCPCPCHGMPPSPGDFCDMCGVKQPAPAERPDAGLSAEERIEALETALDLCGWRRGDGYWHLAQCKLNDNCSARCEQVRKLINNEGWDGRRPAMIEQELSRRAEDAEDALAAAEAEVARLRAALGEWHGATYQCRAATCKSESRWHMKRLDAEMVEHARAALEPNA